MSTLRANALEGMDAKNSITIVAGAGNVTTTNVQEGLAKAVWAGRTDGTPSATGYNSFNIASVTDLGVGNPQCNYTNSMSSATYGGVSGGWTYVAIVDVYTHIGAFTTAKFNLYHIENSAQRDANDDAKPLTGAVFGDLA